MGTERRGALSGAGGGGANMRLSRSRCSGAVMAIWLGGSVKSSASSDHGQGARRGHHCLRRTSQASLLEAHCFHTVTFQCAELRLMI